jgi:hypothetical protein
MASPLLPYANAHLLVVSRGLPSMVNGRVVTTASTRYLMKCYLVRQQSNGTTSGADYLPIRTSGSDILPGAGGQIYLYEGYALQYAEAPNNYDAGDVIPDDLTWTDFTVAALGWLTPGTKCEHMHGIEEVKYSTVERMTGKYGNAGIDEIIVAEIGGIPLLVRSGELVE